MENYVLYDELGRGTYSVVYKGRKKGSVEYVAVHCAEKVKRRELQNIVRLTHELSHPNIVRFHEWYETTNHIWMIVELCTGQNLTTMLEQDGCFPEATVRGFGMDIVNGLNYLHSLGILYCDLRTSKVIMDGTGKVKLSNFSLAKVEEEEEISDLEERDDGEEIYRRPSPIYMAPEVLQGEPYSTSSDLWSLGCVLFELFTGNPPFEAESFSELVTLVIKENFWYPLQTIDAVEVGPSDNFYSLLQSLLCKDVGLRSTWSQLFVHPLWDGALELTEDEEPGKEEQTEIPDVRIEHEQKEERDVKKDGDVSVCEKTKVILGAMVVRNSNAVTQIKGKNRPITAPESGGIKHGTYRVEEIRPHTTESGSMNKMQELTRDQKPQQLAVSSSAKSNAPKKNHQVKHGFGSAPDGGNKVSHKAEHRRTKIDKKELHVAAAASGSVDNLNIESLLYHSSDFIVSSIIDNPKIKKLVIPKWDVKALGISPLTAEQILAQQEDETAKHFLEISKLLEHGRRIAGAPGSMGQRSKLHLSSYLVSILHNTGVANMVANSSLVPSLLQLLKQCSSADLKGRLGLALGVLATNATLIADEFDMNEVFIVLTETIRDNFRNARLKQSLLPCLGEFMFYAATQEQTEGRMNENWEVPSVTFTIIIRCLREGEDSVVQHYAAKTIENIATTDTHHCEKFATAETAQMLWNLFTHCSGDAQKLTAISALRHLNRHAMGLFQHVIDRAGLHAVLNCLVSGVTKVQQAIITMLAALVSKGAHTRRLIEDKEFVHKMMAFLDSPSIVIRGKAFVAVAAMSRDHHVALLHCCQYKLVTYIERDNKRQMPTKTDGTLVTYLKDCLQLCVKTAYRCVPKVVQSVIRALEAVSGRRHPSVAQSKELRSCIPLMSIVLHLVTSSVFRHWVVNETFLRDMGLLVGHVKSIDAGATSIGSAAGATGADDLTNVVLSIVEAIAQHPSLLLQHRALVAHSVLPHLAAMTSSKAGDVRMFCFKMFADIASMFLESETMSDAESDSTQQLTEVITSQLLPQYDTILQDQDPLPSYALKLLLAFLEHSPKFSETIVDKRIVASLGDLLERHGGDVAGPAIQTIISLLDCLVSSGGTDLWLLYEQGLIDHVTSLFVSASALINAEKHLERNFSEILLPLLDTVHGVMKYASRAVREALQAKSAGDEAASSLTKKAERILLEGKPLVELTGVLLQFLCHEDSDIQEWSLRCLYQVVELYGGAYEEALSPDNLEHLARALLDSDVKRQKQVLRIIKRLVSSNTWHAAALKEHGEVLLEAMVEITKVQDTSSNETVAVKSLVVEITKAAGIA